MTLFHIVFIYFIFFVLLTSYHSEDTYIGKAYDNKTHCNYTTIFPTLPTNPLLCNRQKENNNTATTTTTNNNIIK